MRAALISQRPLQENTPITTWRRAFMESGAYVLLQVARDTVRV